MNQTKKYFLIILFFLSSTLPAQENIGFQIARLKYGGGGDWYNDPSAEVNLLNFINENTSVSVNPEYVFVDILNDDIFAYPFLFITGHGNIILSTANAERLREYINKGGFVYVDDDYGMDKSIRREFKKVFPEKVFVELPFSHQIYHSVYDFNNGPPKTHEHDNKPPQGFGLIINNRLSVFYTYESNPSDGWADRRSHNDEESKRIEALRFGTNIIVYALTN